MVDLELYNGNLIKVNTSDFGYLNDLKDFFSEYVENFYFMPKFRAGQWDGKISLFNGINNTFPCGLLFDFMKFHKKNFSFHKLSASDEIKALFKGDDINGVYDLKYKPRDYQLDCIEGAIKYRNNIFVVGTGGGKCISDVEIEVEVSDEDYEKYFL